MITPQQIILAVLPVYLLMATGAVLRKTRILKREHDAGIMHIVFSVLVPCFILDQTLGAEILRNFGTLATGAGLGFLFIVTGIATGWLGAKAIGLTPGKGFRTFALASGCQNFGYAAVPVVEILWGSSALALLFVHNIGVEVAIWSVGVMLISGDKRIVWKRLINGPIIAVSIALLLVSLGLDDKVTGPVRTTMSMIGIGAFPIAILMVGASIADLAGTEKPSWKIAIAACIVRLIIVPALIILAAKFIPMSTELRQILVVQAAMPAALVPILLARIYGGQPGVAVQVVVATTIVSLATLPFVIYHGARFLELVPVAP
ncbi:MAG: AEC family transporter [Akkermansiaceae bacterium]|nr:AEC family transporter [Akkermansiaceae bacterium]MDP4646742.1 AEC family transporter [Akkermansiaceae bacterium]MDP4722008.1 AEC family transporter [Akkermansiaceae bacterium]MDP4779659.1 AEC family transporter [Akkermansiaceae bacterium]MDP4846683.1 AEC family transporter [Akkermansiaceae bacterium]